MAHWMLVLLASQLYPRQLTDLVFGILANIIQSHSFWQFSLMLFFIHSSLSPLPSHPYCSSLMSLSWEFIYSQDYNEHFLQPWVKALPLTFDRVPSRECWATPAGRSTLPTPALQTNKRVCCMGGWWIPPSAEIWPGALQGPLGRSRLWSLALTVVPHTLLTSRGGVWS